MSENTLVAAGTGVTLVLAAFVGSGGLRLEPTTHVLIGLMLGGGALVAAAALRAPRTPARPVWGGGFLLAFTLLAGFTAMSMIWSMAPGESWTETNRALAYLATLAGAVALVRLAPGSWSGLLAGLCLASFVICGWALLTKVFPASLAGGETYARLRLPFEYWNSVGLTAAMGIPAFLWLASRRSGSPLAGALAWPALSLLGVCLMLSYSRGALVALGVGLAFWLSVVPLRLISATVAIATGTAAAVLVAWAFSQDGLITERAPLGARVDAGHELGALLLLVATLLLMAGLAVQFVRAHRPPSLRARRIAGRALAATAALLAALAIIALATAPGGISGQTSKAWAKLTDPNARTPGNTPDRLTATSSVRARYWDEAFKIHAERPWAGAGAGSFAIARTRVRSDLLTVRHAHGFVPQTLADLGWIGLGLSALALVAWTVAALRAAGLRRRDRGVPFDPERIGLLALMTIAIVFGIHSALDWTWLVPANAAAALLAVGWIAGRGPLQRRREPHPEAVPLAAATPWPPDGRRRRLASLVDEARRTPLRVAAAALVAVIAVAAAWAAYQPVRAEHASDEAYKRLGAGAPVAAASIATIATERNPLSVDALFDLAAVEQSRSRLGAAEDALERAVKLEPANVETWRRLGRFQLEALKQPDAALLTFRAAYYLDPKSPLSVSDVVEASRAAQAAEAP